MLAEIYRMIIFSAVAESRRNDDTMPWIRTVFYLSVFWKKRSVVKIFFGGKWLLCDE